MVGGHWSKEFALPTVRKHVLEKQVYLADLEGVPVATFELQTTKPTWYSKDWLAEPDAPAFYLFRMAVLPRCQRQGIGRNVMKQIEEMAGREDRRAVRFDAYDAPAGAGGFYRKCGYSLIHNGSFNGVALEYYEKRV